MSEHNGEHEGIPQTPEEESDFSALNEAVGQGAEAAANAAGIVGPAGKAVGKGAEVASDLTTEQAQDIPLAGKALADTSKIAENAKAATPAGAMGGMGGIPGQEGAQESSSFSEDAELIKGESIQEQAQDVQAKAQKFQTIVSSATSTLGSLINPVTGIIAIVVLIIVEIAVLGLSANQTLGRNSNACQNGEDCSVAQPIADQNCSSGSSSSGEVGEGSWPAGVAPGSDEAIRATYALLLATGFSQEDAVLMTIIAGGESGWNPAARAPGSSATGLFQVLQSHDPSANLLDPVVNAKWAKKLFDASGNANPWQAWPESPLAKPPWVSSATRAAIIANFARNSSRVKSVLGVSDVGGGATPAAPCSGSSGSWTGATCGADCSHLLQVGEIAITNCGRNVADYDGSWAGECLGFVARAYRGSSAGFGTAQEAYNWAKTHGGTTITDWNSVPAGAVVLRSGGSAGHAMIAAGGGMVITTLTSGYSGPCVVKIPGTQAQGSYPLSNFLWIPPHVLWP